MLFMETNARSLRTHEIHPVHHDSIQGCIDVLQDHEEAELVDMKFVKFISRCFVWTGPGRGTDALQVSLGTVALVVDEFKWGQEPAIALILPSGAIAWTPLFSGSGPSEWITISEEW